MIFYEKSLLFANRVGIFTHIVVSLFVYRLWMICRKTPQKVDGVYLSILKSVNGQLLVIDAFVIHIKCLPILTFVPRSYPFTFL